MSSAALTNLAIGSYVFAITAFDVEGAYDSLFSVSSNLLRFSTSSLFGPPVLTVECPLITYTTPLWPGYDPDPSHDVLLDMPEGSLDLRWFARSYPNDVVGYRWALDPVSLDTTGPTRRGDDRRDLQHWTDVDLANTSARIGPFTGNAARREHRLFIEGRTEFDYRSLLVVRLRPVRAAFTSDLLIVDDTRLAPDEVQSGVPRPPSGPWPTAAELDTFLFARGGVPWRGYPAGMRSTPGLFSAYAFDTIGTRTGQRDLEVPLEVLSRYRSVVWIVDPVGATYPSEGVDLLRPQSALRYMSSPGRMNTLAAYVRQGGNLWVMGGGIAVASLYPWNYGGNDSGGITFCRDAGELTADRFLFDACGWRSCVRAVKGAVAFTRLPGAASGLPQRLDLRSPSSDPLPPYRNASQFWPASAGFEFLSSPNVVMEDGNPSAKHVRLEQTLDSLFTAVATLPEPGVHAAMTVHHIRGGGQVVMSGFDIWSFRRSQCQALVDGVLNGMWGLPRRAPATMAPSVLVRSR